MCCGYSTWTMYGFIAVARNARATLERCTVHCPDTSESAHVVIHRGTSAGVWIEEPLLQKT